MPRRYAYFLVVIAVTRQNESLHGGLLVGERRIMYPNFRALIRRRPIRNLPALFSQIALPSWLRGLVEGEQVSTISACSSDE